MNTRRASAMAVAFLMTVPLCWGQSKQWDKRFGGSAGDSGQSIQQTTDGGYILGGFSSSMAGGDKTDNSRGFIDYWMVKVASNGVKQRDRRFGGDQYDYCRSVQTTDGGYILGGSTDSGAEDDKSQGSQGGDDFWIVKVDANGGKQWDKRFGGRNDESLWCVRQTTDGGYILGGGSRSGADGDKTEGSWDGTDHWIVKVASNGVMQWDKRFGGSGTENIRDVQQTADGGYILGGTTDSGADGDKTEGTRGGFDYWIVKVDANGTKQWDKRFGGSGDDYLMVAQQTADGGYILGGRTDSGAGGDKTENSRGMTDYWIVKVNANGTRQWDRRFGGTSSETFSGVRQTTDGGYILGGSSSSMAGGDKTENSRGFTDYWVVKVDAQGNKRWDRTLGGTSNDELSGGIQQTADSGYILCGESDSGLGGEKTEASRGLTDYWIVKLAALPGDAYEPDDSMGTAKVISNGPAQNHSIHELSDRDWAKFVVGSSGATNVSVETSGAAGDTELWVHRGLGGPQIGYNDDFGTGRFSRVTFASLAAGTYYIKVSEFGNNAAIPAYVLKARWTPIVIPPDRYESDNVRTAAKRIRNGKTQNRTIHRAGNRDWAKFTIGRRGARKVRIQTSGASGDTVMRLYNRAGRRLASNDDSGPGRFSRIKKTKLPAGTYYLRIEEKGNNDVLPAYQLYIKWTPR